MCDRWHYFIHFPLYGLVHSFIYPQSVSCFHYNIPTREYIILILKVAFIYRVCLLNTKFVIKLVFVLLPICSLVNFALTHWYAKSVSIFLLLHHYGWHPNTRCMIFFLHMNWCIYWYSAGNLPFIVSHVVSNFILKMWLLFFPLPALWTFTYTQVVSYTQVSVFHACLAF